MLIWLIGPADPIPRVPPDFRLWVILPVTVSTILWLQVMDEDEENARAALEQDDKLRDAITARLRAPTKATQKAA